MHFVPVMLQVLAIACFLVAAFVPKLMESAGWLGLAFYVGSMLLLTLRELFPTVIKFD